MLPEVLVLLEHLWLKFNEIVLLRSSASARYFDGFPIGFNIVLGGQLADGSDATNLLSYMCIRARPIWDSSSPTSPSREYPSTRLLEPQVLVGVAAISDRLGMCAPRHQGEWTIYYGSCA